jgi:hypothetical protein
MECGNSVTSLTDQFRVSFVVLTAKTIKLTVPLYQTIKRHIGVRAPVEVRIFVFMLSIPALGPTQHLIQWVLGVLSPGVKTAGT